ncbi:MAG: site-specific DNA-methyltransferase [Anaerolineae bacterium]|nr:site-specific DNA-methyltransferase [Anaerolineae bacterium]
MNWVIEDKPDVEGYALSDVLNRVIWGNCLEVMRKLPAEIADLVFVDPPYYLQLPKRKLIRWSGTVVEGVDESWDQFESFEEYDAFTEAWLTAVRRLMKPQATLWVIGTYHNIFRVGTILQDLGFWILNNVLWVKTNPVPNFRRVRFTNATETLLWVVKDKEVKSYTINFDQVKAFGMGKVGANVWQLPVCAGKERVKGEDGRKLHPTQKPERLLERVILSSSNPGDVVLDPMAGVGTTGVVAHRHGRRFILIEREPRYVAAIEQRLWPGIWSLSGE